MGEGRERRAIRETVMLAQDNILLRKTIYLMGKYIMETGTFSAVGNNRQQYNAITKYFKMEALNLLDQKGYNMGINTPWGKDAAKLYHLSKEELADEVLSEEDGEEYELEDEENEEDEEENEDYKDEELENDEKD